LADLVAEPIPSGGQGARFLPAQGMQPDIDYPGLMERLRTLLPQLNQSGIELCAVDLRLALTMLDRARLTHDPSTRARNLANAQHALETVLHHLSKLALSPEQSRDIDAMLGELKAGLADTLVSSRRP
jgi:hypothetical protein